MFHTHKEKQSLPKKVLVLFFDDADGVSVDIVMVYCRPECSMPRSVECLLEVYKYMRERSY